MADVVLRGVSRIFPDGTVAVNCVDLSIPDGQFMVLVGPSGCGKSTTLRMIAGLDQISSGEITIGSRVVNRLPPKDRDIAMVFQNYALYPHMTVRQNLAFALNLRQGGLLRRLVQRIAAPAKATAAAHRRKEIGLKVHAVAEKLGIEHLLQRRPRELSGGERQRVALGRALVREPVAYLFDEPLSNLDARLRLEMRRELKQLHAELRSTMIYVTHDQVEALTLGDRIAVMRNGEIQQTGSPREVYDHPRNRFVAGFLGTPPMNFLEARLRVDEGQWSLETIAGRVAVDKLATERLQRRVGDQVVLGFRPEAVHLVGALEGAAERLPAKVTLVEPLGDVTIVNMRLGVEGMPGSADVVCKVDAVSQLESGENVALEIDTRCIHFFDIETGENLAYAGGRPTP